MGNAYSDLLRELETEETLCIVFTAFSYSTKYLLNCFCDFIYHHHHYQVEGASRTALIPFPHPFLSSILVGSSFRRHPVSSTSWSII